MNRSSRSLLLVLILVLTATLTGCSGRAQAGKIAAQQEIDAGDKLLAAKDYDGALKRYVKAANETTASPVHDEALSKAAGALAAKVEREPLPQQVAAFKEFLGSIPDPVLPLRAHNWLSDTLRENADSALALAKASAAENKRVLLASTPAKTTAKKPVAKKPVTKKPVAKKKTTTKAAPKPASATKTATATVVTTSAAVATVSVAATRTPAATASAAPSAPVFVFPSAGELKAVSADLSVLGQPPAMEQLYASLAEVKTAMDAAEAARAPFSPKRPLTLAQRRTLSAADARLVRALQQVNTLLASL